MGFGSNSAFLKFSGIFSSTFESSLFKVSKYKYSGLFEGEKCLFDRLFISQRENDAFLVILKQHPAAHSSIVV